MELIKKLNIPHFKGVFPKDVRPADTISKQECGIFNLDDAGNEGTNWTTYFVDGNRVEYFDSFGMPAPEAVEKYLKSSDLPVVYNTRIYQKFISSRCGWYCLYFLLQRAKGKDLLDVLDDFDKDPSDYNEKLVRTV